MSHRALPEPWTAYRIGDPLGEFPTWRDGGARLFTSVSDTPRGQT